MLSTTIKKGFTSQHFFSLFFRIIREELKKKSISIKEIKNKKLQLVQTMGQLQCEGNRNKEQKTIMRRVREIMSMDFNAGEE